MQNIIARMGNYLFLITMFCNQGNKATEELLYLGCFELEKHPRNQDLFSNKCVIV